MKASKIFGGLLFFMIMLMLTSCMQKEEVVKKSTVVEEKKEVERETKEIPTDEELIAVLQANIDTFHDKDLKAHMKTIHSQSPAYDATESDVKYLMDLYTLNMELVETEVIEKTEKMAKVVYTQRTIKLVGPEFKNNELTGVHTLRPENGEWKIVSTVVETTVYLDEFGFPMDESIEVGGTTDYVYRGIMEQLNFFIDTRQWQEAYYGEEAGYALAEFILAGETIDRWSELFSIHFFEDGYTNIGVENYVASMEETLRASVTGDITFETVELTESDAVYEFAIGNDPNELDQHEIARIFAYNDHLFLIRYTILGPPMDEAYKTEWINRLKQASVLSEGV
ncbi:hypothetical protein JMM81_15155 [Bacillus sp. V3B]|uniref:hypothetical protein n=1 Tax=Bacillus sp. V3B TaxID=2804915 RepID=UPI00210EE541|nr:hypothetical protein [Bacillus sp. V3B]MCQ6276263.1 hypothetical protein [Bacillus sp. V3B]